MNFAAVGVEGLNSGYYLWSVNGLAKIADQERDEETYQFYYKLLKEHSKAKDKPWKDIKAYDKSRKEKRG